MRSANITFPIQSFNAICATQTVTATAGAFLVLNGTLASPNNFNAPASSTNSVLANPYSTTAANIQPYQFVSAGNGIARPVTAFATITATAVGFKITGFDLLGNVITASFTGASGGTASTATDVNNLATGSGTDFHIVSAVQTTASLANVAIGFGATGQTQWVQQDTFVTPFNVTVSVVTASSQPVTIQQTPDNPNTATAPNIFNHATLVTVVANTQGNYLLPVPFCRAVFAATGPATGGATVYFQQTGA